MLCSKPAATKALIGNRMDRTRPVVVRALMHSQTARHTRALQKMPRTTAWVKPRLTLALAMVRACSPTAPWPKAYWPLR